MATKIKYKKKPSTVNKKILLWISAELLKKMDKVKSKEISYQECIRQILERELEGVK